MSAKSIAILFLVVTHASGRDVPQEIVQPELVVPGEWVTDQAEKFLFLPFTTPPNIAVENCKLMANGDQLLIVVTESPKEEPETNALKKYKLVLEALKAEVGPDEDMLDSKLNAWLQTEDDEEVQVHIQAALDSLRTVAAAKKDKHKRTLTLPLGLASKNQSVSQTKAVSFLAKDMKPHANVKDATEVEEHDAEHALTSVHRATKRGGGQLDARIIKESFAVEIPYPVPVDRIFVIKSDEKTLIAGMPLDKHSLEAKGISTGGKPFVRVPIFDRIGKHLAGPMMFGLPVPSFGLDNLKPLE